MFVVFRNPSDYMHDLFEGYSSNEVVCIDKSFAGIFGWLNAFQNSISINNKINLPFKKIWYPFYLDYKLLDKYYQNGESIYFVFFEGNRLAYQKEFLDYLKKKYSKCKLIFRYINILSKQNMTYYSFVKQSYDLILTMDKKDSEREGLLYVPNTYWNSYRVMDNKYERDVIFLGGSKGRISQLDKCAHLFDKIGITYDFYVADCAENEKIEKKGFHYIKNIKYKEYLRLLNRSRASLEILVQSQSGSTLRATEAVFFDKILLTTNSMILTENFYNSKYMVLINQKNIETIKEVIHKNVYYENKKMIDHQCMFDKIIDFFEE